MKEDDERLAKITARHREILKDAAAALAHVSGHQSIRATPETIALFEIDDALAAILEHRTLTNRPPL